VISEHGILHGINTYASKNGVEGKGLFMLVYNRVGVERIRNQLKYDKKSTLISNMNCIINGIFHGLYCV